MTCKLHIPWRYDPWSCSWSCSCGAHIVTEVELADAGKSTQIGGGVMAVNPVPKKLKKRPTLKSLERRIAKLERQLRITSDYAERAHIQTMRVGPRKTLRSDLLASSRAPQLCPICHTPTEQMLCDKCLAKEELARNRHEPEVQSRSMLRRIAASKGEPAPDFSSPSPAPETTPKTGNG